MSFKDDLLASIAITTEGKPTVQIEAIQVAQLRNLTFRDGWLRQAVKSLEENGLIRVMMYMGGGENLGMRLCITGNGLEQAEHILNVRGSNLYEEIDDYTNSTIN